MPVVLGDKLHFGEICMMGLVGGVRWVNEVGLWEGRGGLWNRKGQLSSLRGRVHGSWGAFC